MERIGYYSTNRNLEGVPGIVPFKERVSFKEALFMGQAPDEGLFMPNRIPWIDAARLHVYRGEPYWKIALLVANKFLEGEMAFEDLKRAVRDSYNFPVPLEKVSPRRGIMRLDQGPTASFKDFAARLMARLMSCFLAPGQQLHILVATSGDTGSAVGWGGLTYYAGANMPFESFLSVSLETAHPAKFPNEIKELLGFEPELPESMKAIDSRTGEPPLQMVAEYAALKEYLLSRC